MINLDHLIVLSRDRKKAAKFLAQLLGVKSSKSFDIFWAVYVNDKLTMDFGQSDQFEIQHYCFSVNDDEFDQILGRLKEKDISYRSTPHGPADKKINRANGGKNLYWSDPIDGHYWEILTVSYARPRP